MGAFLMKTLFVTKVGMTSVFMPNGNWVGATILRYTPITVDSLRTTEKHGYAATRLKFQDPRTKKTKNSFREVRTDETPEVGSEIKIEEVIAVGDKVSVTGISKGKGTAGVVKRHNFRGGPRTHGQSDRERAPGSSGSGTTPGRVFKGKRRAGHMGVDRVTRRGVEVLTVDTEKKEIVLKGAVAGNKNTLIEIKKV